MKQASVFVGLLWDPSGNDPWSLISMAMASSSEVPRHPSRYSRGWQGLCCQMFPRWMAKARFRCWLNRCCRALSRNSSAEMQIARQRPKSACDHPHPHSACNGDIYCVSFLWDSLLLLVAPNSLTSSPAITGWLPHGSHGPHMTDARRQQLADMSLAALLEMSSTGPQAGIQSEFRFIQLVFSISSLFLVICE